MAEVWVLGCVIVEELVSEGVDLDPVDETRLLRIKGEELASDRGERLTVVGKRSKVDEELSWGQMLGG